MVKIYINNKEVLVPKDSTVLEACNTIGIEIPRFCYHKRLNIAGNCRMCLVEVEKAPKPVASCTFPITANLKIFTDSPLVKKARENVLEFLLANHPLDCPICDQGGECDLQDQSLFYGADSSRFYEFKRGVEDKNCGPLVKTIMTRCIHCTRCVRFMSDVAGLEVFGTTNRGRDTEIGTYLKKTLQTELSGNVIDLCPVGALTSKPYAFLARPWELKTLESIDLSDALGSNLRIDIKDSEIVRVLPKLNEDINEEWISDKARFNFDALKTQRVARPYFKGKTGKLELTSWKKCLKGLNELLLTKKPNTDLSFVCSVFLDLKTLAQIKEISHQLGIKKVGFSRKFLVNTDFQENFILATQLKEIEHADFCLFVGTNPRYEAPMLNLKIRKRFRSGLFKAYSIGNCFQLSYRAPAIGISTEVLVKIAEGKHPLCKHLRQKTSPVVLFNASLAERHDYLGIKKSISTIESHLKVLNGNWKPICFLNQEANQTGGFFLGLNNSEISKKKGRESNIYNGIFKQQECLNFKELQENIFIGSHGNDSLLKANIILPTCNPFESEGNYMNAEGTIQKTEKVLNAPGLIRENSKLLNLISDPKPYPKLLYKNLEKICKHSKILNTKIEGKSMISRVPFRPFFTDFFSSDAISEKSLVMAKTSKAYRSNFTNFIAFN